MQIIIMWLHEGQMRTSRRKRLTRRKRRCSKLCNIVSRDIPSAFATTLPDKIRAAVASWQGGGGGGGAMPPLRDSKEGAPNWQGRQKG